MSDDSDLRPGWIRIMQNYQYRLPWRHHLNLKVVRRILNWYWYSTLVSGRPQWWAYWSRLAVMSLQKYVQVIISSSTLPSIFHVLSVLISERELFFVIHRAQRHNMYSIHHDMHHWPRRCVDFEWFYMVHYCVVQYRSSDQDTKNSIIHKAIYLSVMYLMLSLKSTLLLST